MGSGIMKFITYFVLPVVLFIVASGYHFLLALAAVILYYAVVLINNRGGVYSSLATIHYHKGDADKALHYLRKAYKTGKCKPNAISTYAFILLRSGNLKEAETVLNALLYKPISHDDKMYAKSILALVTWKKGQLDEAIALYDEIMESYRTTSIYGSKGYLLILKGDLEKALEFNLEAYDYNNTDSIIIDNLGQTYYLMGDYEKALQYYEELEKINPQFPAGWYNFGLVLMKLEQYEKALECFKKAQSFKLTFLSAVSAEEIQSAIENAEKKLSNA